MIFEPHLLQTLVVSGDQVADGYANPGQRVWVTYGRCRCDDNGQRERVSVNGVLYDYKYHVVYEGGRIAVGTEVRALDDEGNVRGEGTVVATAECNYFDYAQIWM
jgi:hypothetical protein